MFHEKIISMPTNLYQGIMISLWCAEEENSKREPEYIWFVNGSNYS